MAECGDLGRSILVGSDAVFDFTCSPCKEDGSMQEAVKYCPSCDQHLCSFCTRQHGRSTASKCHQLSDDLDVKIQGSTAVVVAKCSKHPDRVIEMYCGAHDIVCCAFCVAKEHRSCDNVDEVSDVANTHFNKTEFQALLEKIEQMQPKLENIREKKQNNIEALEDNGRTILKEIEDFYGNLIAHIDDLKTKAQYALDKKRTKLIEEIKDEISTMDEALDDIQSSKEQITNAGNTNIAHQFVQHKLSQNSLSSAESLLDQMNAHDQTLIKFSPNNRLQESVLQAKEMGTIEKESLGEVLHATSTSADELMKRTPTTEQLEVNIEVPIYQAQAHVETYYDNDSNWKFKISHRLTDIAIYHHTGNNTIRVMVRTLHGEKVIINYSIRNNQDYNQATPMLHQFRDCDGRIHGVKFANREESELFSKAMQSALDTQSRTARTE